MLGSLRYAHQTRPGYRSPGRTAFDTLPKAMDSASRIETFKQWLRFRFQNDVGGLRRYVTALGEGDAEQDTVITQGAFEGGSHGGQIVLEPLEKLRAAMDVLAELDPTSMPTQPSAGRFVDFSTRYVET